MKRCLAALVFALVSFSIPSEALAGLPIRVPAWHPPISIKVTGVPHAPTDLALAGGRNPVSPEVQRELEGLRDDVVSRLDQGIESIALTTQARKALWKCAGSGLESTADGVGEAMAGGEPDAGTVYASAAAGCLKDNIPELSSPSDIDATSHYLLNLSAAYIKEASEAARNEATQDPATAPVQSALAQQRWLEATARTVSRRAATAATDGDVPYSAPMSPPADGSPVLPWLGAGALALGVGFIAARRRMR
jgi:hypothetical protein